ncbi:MAG: hypothetical protein WCK57_09535 [Verrucomicrobiae bacterium]
MTTNQVLIVNPSVFALVDFLFTFSTAATPPPKPNILCIVVDDMRPELSC